MEPGRKLGLLLLLGAVAVEVAVELERSIAAAAEVVLARTAAAGGSGWLCFPSYVVIRMVLSCTHLWTCVDYDNSMRQMQKLKCKSNSFFFVKCRIIINVSPTHFT